MPRLRSREQGEDPQVSSYLPLADRWKELVEGWEFNGNVETMLGVATGGGFFAGYVTGVMGQAARVQNIGAEHNWTFTHATAFQRPGDFTLTAWIDLSAVGSGTRYMATADPNNQTLADYGFIHIGGTGLIFRMRDTSDVNTDTTIVASPSGWQLYHASYNSTTKVARVGYNGGNFTNSAALPNGLKQSATRFRCSAGSTGHQTDHDQHALFSVAKDDTWIELFYNGGSGFEYPD